MSETQYGDPNDPMRETSTVDVTEEAATVRSTEDGGDEAAADDAMTVQRDGDGNEAGDQGNQYGSGGTGGTGE